MKALLVLLTALASSVCAQLGSAHPANALFTKIKGVRSGLPSKIGNGPWPLLYGIAQRSDLGIVLSPCEEALFNVFKKNYTSHAEILDAWGHGIDDLGNYDECIGTNAAKYWVVEEVHGNATSGTINPDHPAHTTTKHIPVFIGLCLPEVCDPQTEFLDGVNSDLQEFDKYLCHDPDQIVKIISSIVNGVSPEEVCILLNKCNGTNPMETNCLHCMVFVEMIEQYFQNPRTEDEILDDIIGFCGFLGAPIGNSTDTSDEISFHATCLEPRDWSTGALGVLAFLIVMGILCVLGTFAEAARWYWGPRKKRRSLSTQLVDEDDAMDTDILLGSEAMLKPHPLIDFLLLFSVPKNMKSLFSTPPGSSLVALNGIRGLSMFWVIWGHVSEWFKILADNPAFIESKVQTTWWFQLTSGAYFSVDSFFFLSGFLVAFGLIKKFNQKGRIPFMQAYVHRFARLIPLYFTLYFVYWKMSPYFGHGFLYRKYAQFVEDNCRDVWWSNLLFINNFYPKHFAAQCDVVTWYIAVDTQMYLVAPILVWLWKKNKRAGLITIGALLAISVIAKGLYVGILKIIANPNDELPDEYQDNVYSNPLTRASPFLVGIMLAYFMDHTRGERDIGEMPIKSDWSKTFWSVGAVVAALSFYCPVFLVHAHDNWTLAESVIYSMFAKLGWGLGLAVLCYYCFVSPRNPLNLMLGAGFWGPIARLTYGAYLTHPMVVMAFYADRGRLLHFSYFNLRFDFISCLVVTYGFAVIASMLVEKPFMNLEKWLLTRKKQPKGILDREIR